MLKKMLAVLLVLALLPAGAFACTAVCIGSNLTEDGSTIFARLEEYYSDEGWPKLFDVIPEGVHAAGEVYNGCYGFTWTFTHDSYGYTAVSSLLVLQGLVVVQVVEQGEVLQIEARAIAQVDSRIADATTLSADDDTIAALTDE